MGPQLAPNDTVPNDGAGWDKFCPDGTVPDGAR